MSVCLEKNNFNNGFNSNNYSSQTTSPCVESSFVEVLKKENMMKQLSLMISRSRQRKVLANLDSRLLADIGYSTNQVRQELSKPFWK